MRSVAGERVLGFLRRWGQGPPRALIGAALLVLGAGAFLVSTGVEETPAPKVTRGDLPVNAGAGNLGDISAHNSPTVARNPANRSNVAVVNRIDTPRFSCALHVSFDGGDRWESHVPAATTSPLAARGGAANARFSSVPMPIPKGEEPKCYAPDVSFASDGTMYVSFVTLRGTGNVPNAVWLLTSRDGGRTLSRPRKLLGKLAFQVRLTVDPANPRRLSLTWLQAPDVALFRFTNTGNPIRYMRSDDGGQTWGAPVRVSSGARERVVAPAPATGPRGELYVLFLDLGGDRLDYEGGHQGRGGPPYPGRFQLVLARWLDGGRSWRESVVDDRIVPTERFLVFLPPFPSVAVDRSGRVYAAFHDGRLGKPDVWLWSLAPGASAWTEPTRVNDTPERDGTSQYLPKLAVAPGGRVDVAYYDRRSDAKDVVNDVSFQSSFDDGASFTKRVRLTSRRFDSRIGFGSERKLPDLGNRIGLMSDDGGALAVWADTRAGTFVSNKQDLSRTVVGFAEADVSKPVRDGLRYGGVVVALLGLAILASIFRPARRSRTAPG